MTNYYLDHNVEVARSIAASEKLDAEMRKRASDRLAEQPRYQADIKRMRPAFAIVLAAVSATVVSITVWGYVLLGGIVE